ncbi:sugar ABC transporter substrate-binding protein [Streptomyces sp. CNQ085]|uniref:ABC transporter substrate-binding protein n=1 Tax=Streptomyces sp. CNQ085 TaxID=2886944 RepID=UPI001F50B0CC|nr:sugar ABC transporter substrate-binding protein [Streptomyces sp. CNQ085]MCI0384141.1 sugar ABC transporter substrate-binding protein [Streptomyces sp. CNQ085]
MNTQLRRAAVAAAATAMAVSLAACGSAKEAGGNGSEGDDEKKDGPLTIGLLLPEDQTARYENFDRPLIEKRIKELCSDCEVSYVNAKEDASTQQQQMNSMITKKVDAIILDAVDAKSIAGSVNKADQAGIPVVAYDRLAEGPISAYTSFDNEQVGKVQGTALLEELGGKAEDGQIVMMNGSPTDPNAAMFKKGAKSVLDGKVKVGKSYDTTGWKPEEANKNMSGAIASLGKENIVGVYSANDGMAGGIITALKSAGVDPLPPVTGQDAELAGLQRIVSGDQFMTVYKPFQPEAYAAAEMAVALARGEEPETETTVDSATTKDVPATLIEPIAVTVENLKDTVVEDGLYTVEEICTAKYAEACEKAGLK